MTRDEAVHAMVALAKEEGWALATAPLLPRGSRQREDAWARADRAHDGLKQLAAEWPDITLQDLEDAR